MYQPVDKHRGLPATIEDVVGLIMEDLPLRDRTLMSRMEASDLWRINDAMGDYILNEFRIWTGNHRLLKACIEASGKDEEGEFGPSMVIIRSIWERLKRQHVLRRIK